MRTYRSFAAFLLLSLTACAQLGLPTPQTFEERLTVGISSVTAARQTALTLLQANKISADDAQNVQDQADNVRQALDIARSLKAANLSAAEDKLSAAISALNVLNTYLARRQQ